MIKLKDVTAEESDENSYAGRDCAELDQVGKECAPVKEAKA